jgi:hypothetical protein
MSDYGGDDYDGGAGDMYVLPSMRFSFPGRRVSEPERPKE